MHIYLLSCIAYFIILELVALSKQYKYSWQQKNWASIITRLVKLCVSRTMEIVILFVQVCVC